MPFLKVYVSETLEPKPEDARLFLKAACECWNLPESAMLVTLIPASIEAMETPAVFMELDSYVPDPTERRQKMAAALSLAASGRYGITTDQVWIRYSHIDGFSRGGQYVF